MSVERQSLQGISQVTNIVESAVHTPILAALAMQLTSAWAAGQTLSGPPSGRAHSQHEVMSRAGPL